MHRLFLNVIHKVTICRRYRTYKRMPHRIRQAGLGKFFGYFIVPVAAASYSVFKFIKYRNIFEQQLEEKVPSDGVILQERKTMKAEEPSYKRSSHTAENFFIPELPKIRTLVNEKEVSEASVRDCTWKKLPKGALSALDLKRLEYKVEVAASDARKGYFKVIYCFKMLNNEFLKMEQSIIIGDEDLCNTEKDAGDKLAGDSLAEIEEYEAVLINALKTNNEEKIVTILNKVHTAKEYFYKTKILMNIMNEYWKNAQKAEIETTIPSNVNLHEQNSNINPGLLKLIASHDHYQLLQPNSELHLKEYINALRTKEETATMLAQINYMLDIESFNMELENQKGVVQLKIDVEEEQQREQLEQKKENDCYYMQDIANTNGKELILKNGRVNVEGIQNLKLNHMLAKFLNIDAILKPRAKFKHSVYQIEAFRAACQVSWLSVILRDASSSEDDTMEFFKNIYTAISKVSNNDEFIKKAIENSPQQEQNDNTFHQHLPSPEITAYKLALVPKNNAGVSRRISSYIQSSCN